MHFDKRRQKYPRCANQKQFDFTLGLEDNLIA